MRYKLADKQKRNKKLIKYYSRHPDITYRAIAKIFHISPSRAWRILAKGEKEDGTNTTAENQC